MKQLIEKILGLFTRRIDFTLHCLCSFCIAAALFIMMSGHISKLAAAIVAVVVTVLVGVCKELIDKYVRGQFIEKGDLICDMLGVLTFIVCVIISIV